MGKTVTEKILAKASGRAEVSPGDFLEDISAQNPITSGGMGNMMARWEELGAKDVFDPLQINVVDGHTGATASHGTQVARAGTKAWVKAMGIPMENMYDYSRAGIEHVVAGDKAWALPGTLMLQNMDGHTSTLGALGAFAVPLSHGGMHYLITGKTWIQVPPTAKFTVTGKLPEGVFARDVFEYILSQIGGAGCSGHVMEWVGSYIENLGMDGRKTLCCNALFCGAWTGIVPPDKTTIDYVKARTDRPFEPLLSDADAEYDLEFSYDISNLEPQVVPGPDRDNVHPISELEGEHIDRGFIGSCENSYMSDLRVAAQILKGRKINPGVQLNITPGSVEIYKQALKEGLIEIFADADAMIAPPNCGMCWGANTPLNAGETVASTNTCNYRGRMGSRDGHIILMSPATAAASCIEGKITDPRKFLA
jgi:3-isopropylmalate/(R)-2-methylmalate dehydratase large subunit